MLLVNRAHQVLVHLLIYLECRSEGIQDKLTSKNNPLALEVYTPPIQNNQPPAPAPPSTPMPDQSEYAGLSPAWNPLSLSPSPNLFAWLADPIFQGIRIKFAERADPDIGIQASPRVLEFRGLVDTETARVRDGMRSREIAFSRLVTLKPLAKGDWVVPISGEYMGKVYKVQIYGDQHCTIRKSGQRLRKHDTDISISTSELVQVFPPS